jgi:hypothetical protein
MELPKNVMLPTWAFLGVFDILKYIDIEALPENIRGKYAAVKMEFEEKRSRMRNRFAYGDILAAKTEPEKDAAMKNYLITKNMPKDL